MTWVWAAARAGHLVAGQGIAVHGVDPPVAPDHLGQGHRDVAAAGADVEAAPARAQAEPVQGGDQWPAVHVVAQARELTHGRGPVRLVRVHGPALYGRSGIGILTEWSDGQPMAQPMTQSIRPVSWAHPVRPITCSP